MTGFNYKDLGDLDMEASEIENKEKYPSCFCSDYNPICENCLRLQALKISMEHLKEIKL